MLRHFILAAALLCATVHAQDTASSATTDAANAQATPDGSAAAQNFGSSFCQNVLPGCQRCTVVFVRNGAQTASTPDAATASAAATPDTFGRKVFICTQCLPGFELAGTGNLNDPNPRFCVPAGAPTPCTSVPPSDPTTTLGFRNCPLSTLGAICRAECAVNTFGTGLEAQCVVNPATNTPTWVITGFCTRGIAVCPATPPVSSAPGSVGFQNCPTNLGATCTASCANGATGPGYTARCLLNSQRRTAVVGAPAWVVTGSCATLNNCRNNCGRRNLIDATTKLTCYCDYWCNLYNDCCGGMNAAAATAKDAACPRMKPEANNLELLLTCSNLRGLFAGVDSCASYRPGNCWCDKFCTAAGDCCNNCPLRCAATCPARTTTTAVVESVDSTAAPGGLCGFDEAAQRIAKLKEAQSSSDANVSPALFTPDFQSRVQRCQAALIQTDLSTTTITIPTFIASVGLGNQGAQYSATRASQLIGRLNAAYGRSGFQFNLVKYVDNFVFTSQNTLDGNDCLTSIANPLGPIATGNPNCERCRIYRQIVPPSLQGSKSLVIYMTPKSTGPSNGPETIGSAYLPQFAYNPFPISNALEYSCIDGVYGLTFPDAPGGLEDALKKDTQNIAHEIGHWLGLNHPWNDNRNQALTDAQLCAQSTGPSAIDVVGIATRLTDGVRDTTPQIQLRTPNNGPLTQQFFSCNADGSFNPANNAQGPAKACNGAAPTGGKYYNNFNNIMAYYANSCGARQRAKTFSAGQLARMRCVWSCYRDNQCGTGSFFG